jgi:hypothetical protein
MSASNSDPARNAALGAFPRAILKIAPQAAAAAQVDHQALLYPAANKDVQYAGGGLEGKVSVTNVVDVREVLSAPLRHIAALATPKDILVSGYPK